MKDSARGTTLLEVMVAMGIFGLLLTLVTSLYVTGFRTYKKGSGYASLVRTTATAFDRMSRELRQCHKIYSPSQGNLTPLALASGYIPFAGQNTPFIFVRYNAAVGANQVLAYTVDKRQSALLRLVYDPAFDPNTPSTQTVLEEKSVLPSVSNFSLKLSNVVSASSLNAQFLQIDLTSVADKGNLELESRVKIQGGF